MLGIAKFLSLVTVSAIAFEVSAADVDKKHAVTDLNLVDEDFAFQGEYIGSVFTGQQTWQPIGLQVVALGGGKFAAVEYAGGLPGSGGYGPPRMKVQGERRGDAVVLENGPLKVTIRGGRAILYLHSRGFDIAELEKVERVSQTLDAPPPAGATVLFDGSHTDQFKNGRMTQDGLLMAGTQFKEVYQDFTLHLEFRLPYMPYARGQGRSNSGVYLQSRYEVQILDSFGLEGKHNECGALYRYRKPDVNMCFPPLAWQTYDIDFTSPRFAESGNKTQNARLTVRHNGVLIHDRVDVERKTGAGAQESPKLLPIKLQHHGNPVRFRNIWIVDHKKSAPAVQPSPEYSTQNANVEFFRMRRNGCLLRKPFRP